MRIRAVALLTAGVALVVLPRQSFAQG